MAGGSNAFRTSDQPMSVADAKFRNAAVSQEDGVRRTSYAAAMKSAGLASVHKLVTPVY